MEAAMLVALIQMGAQIGPPFVAWLIQLFQSDPKTLASITPEMITALKSSVKSGDDYFK